MNKVIDLIKRLERRRPGVMTALCTHSKTGERKVIPLRELIHDFGTWNLEKIVDNGDLKDLDDYFKAFREYVRENYDAD